MIHKRIRCFEVVAMSLFTALTCGCDMSFHTIREDDTISEPYRHGSIEPTSQVEYNSKGAVFTVNGVKFTMINVEGGTFQMGVSDEDYYALTSMWSSPAPLHAVTLSSYQIGQTEVTNELWYALMPKDASYSEGCGTKPQSHSYYECEEFIEKLNSITNQKFRFPTDAEWEYAARGGKYSNGYVFAGSNNIDDVAWYSYNSTDFMDVALKRPNELGLYDMTGNESEWCLDISTGYSVARGGDIYDEEGHSYVWNHKNTDDSYPYALRLVLPTTDDDTPNY